MDRFLNTWVGFMCGVLFSVLLPIIILECCETKFENVVNLVDKHKTFEYKDRVYRTVLDTALTDSIHEWRK